MLQFIAEPNDKYSIPEQAQMAIEGGCKWIILRMPEASDSEVRDVCTELVPLCKETETILTLENHIEQAKELGMHGVHLRHSSMTPGAVREQLGPEAIVGVEVGMASAALPLAHQDIDYVSFPPDKSLDNLKENVDALRKADFALPIVAEGNFNAVEILTLLQMGISGIAEHQHILQANDPVAETAELINALTAK